MLISRNFSIKSLSSNPPIICFDFDKKLFTVYYVTVFCYFQNETTVICYDDVILWFPSNENECCLLCARAWRPRSGNWQSFSWIPKWPTVTRKSFYNNLKRDYLHFTSLKTQVNMFIICKVLPTLISFVYLCLRYIMPLKSITKLGDKIISSVLYFINEINYKNL